MEDGGSRIEVGRQRIEDRGLRIACDSGGFLFHIPERYTPETILVPTAEEVEPWVETIIRLWDDETLYRECSEKARAHAQQWHPDRLGPVYAEFFGTLSVESGALSDREQKAKGRAQKPDVRDQNSQLASLNPERLCSATLNPQPSTLNAFRLTSIVLVTHTQLEHKKLCI